MDHSARPATARPSPAPLFAVAAMAIAAIPVAALFAQPAGAPFTVTETGRGFGDLQSAVASIGDGRGTIAIAPGTYAQCAVQDAGEVTYLAAEPGTAVLDGVACEGKGALVLRGRAARVAGIVFRNIAVPDRNGAGIRLEKGDLTIAQSWFRDSEQGILTADDPGAKIVIDKSTFTGLGTCEGAGGCAHSIYVGDYGGLRVTRSRFERGTGGHYVKSRARRIEVASSSFDDSAGRGTNYMIDLPAGATGQIADNWFVQGRDKENYSAFIAIGAEGGGNPSAGLRIAGNDARFAPNVRRDSTFVADWTGARLALGDNSLGAGLKPFEKR